MDAETVRSSTAGAVVAALLLWAGSVGAVPTSLQHQGRLLNDDGEPKTGQVTLKFTIYDAKSGGSIVWESAEKQVSLGDNGFYSVTLGGQQNPIDSSTLSGNRLWIGLKVDQNPELSPRIPVRSVPYAIRAGHAESVADASVGSDQIQSGAVDSSKVSGLDWNKVSSKPTTLSSLQCSMSGAVAEYDGSQWTCGTGGSPLNGQSCGGGQFADGVSSNGTLQCRSVPDHISEVKTGQGLSGGGSSGSVTVEADYSSVQQRVSGNCSAGDTVVSVNQDGTVNCQPAGYGANPSVESDSSCGEFLPAQTCPGGEENIDFPSCDEVNVGAYCEVDAGCNLDSSLDNCGGFGDFYIKVAN